MRTSTGVETDEAQEWRRARTGDGEAFGRLFDRSQARVYRHASRLVDTRHDAEDVTAGAFLELWRRRDQVRLVDGSVVPWLLVTTTNLALNQRRGLNRYRGLLARLPRTEPTAPDAGRLALARADLDVHPHLVAAIRQLPPADQQLVALVALEHYPLREAATVVGLSPEAARSRWQRVRRRLAGSVDPAAFDAEPQPVTRRQP